MNGEPANVWLYRTILAAETTVLVGLMVLLFGVMPNVVTKEDLQERAPWLRDREVVMHRLEAVEGRLVEVEAMQRRLVERWRQAYPPSR